MISKNKQLCEEWMVHIYGFTCITFCFKGKREKNLVKVPDNIPIIWLSTQLLYKRM